MEFYKNIDILDLIDKNYIIKENNKIITKDELKDELYFVKLKESVNPLNNYNDLIEVRKINSDEMDLIIKKLKHNKSVSLLSLENEFSEYSIYCLVYREKIVINNNIVTLL